MAWVILVAILLKICHLIYQLVVTDKDALSRAASVLVIAWEGACAYWLYFVSGLFAAQVL